MSLDGFLTGPDDAMEWVFECEGPNAVVDEVIRTTGAILAGRRWHDLAIVRLNGHVRFRQSERGRCDRPRGGERQERGSLWRNNPARVSGRRPAGRDRYPPCADTTRCRYSALWRSRC